MTQAAQGAAKPIPNCLRPPRDCKKNQFGAKGGSRIQRGLGALTQDASGFAGVISHVELTMRRRSVSTAGFMTNVMNSLLEPQYSLTLGAGLGCCASLGGAHGDRQSQKFKPVSIVSLDKR